MLRDFKKTIVKVKIIITFREKTASFAESARHCCLEREKREAARRAKNWALKETKTKETV